MTPSSAYALLLAVFIVACAPDTGRIDAASDAMIDATVAVDA